MRCPKCGTESLPGKRFCAECGSPLPIRCPKCGAETPANANFCADCGTALAGIARLSSDSSAIASATGKEIRITPEQGDAARAIDGERKTVTTLFADIKGSMELMEDLDPEEARAIVDPALKLMIDAVHRYGGYVVQSTGDGIFALFGAPLAHEDHPQRGLYAALRLQERLGQYSNQLRSQGRLPLQARVGLNTGEVVVRSIETAQGHAEYTPIGHSTSLAARMQALAPIGSIAATDATRKLCEGYFTFKSLGPTVVKGVTEPVNVYEVTGLGQLRTRLQRAAARGLTKFVGREREMEALRHAAEQAQAGHGQIVAVMADPGVGKSRLFYEFKAIQSGAQRASSAGRNACPAEWMVLEAFSVSHGKASAYLPVLDLLSQYFEISQDDDDRKRGELILGKVLSLDRQLEDTLPYLYSLQAIAETGDSLAQMDPQIRRRRTMDAIKRILLRESINQPLMIIFEDLHWIDSETQALLNLLVDTIANARILLLVNYRPEYRHEWGSRIHYTQLRLDPLARESAGEMLDALLSVTAPSPAPATDLEALKRLIIERTQGTPFFMEEIVQALFEEGVLQRNGTVKLAQPISAIKVPPTVQALLASRIDRLSAQEKELLQTLAVLGREFTLKLVQRVTLKSNDELDLMLAKLQLREFINEQPALGDVEYSFKHALTQEVAANSLLSERRRTLHDRAARALEELSGEQLDDHYGELAHHYLLSENVAKATHYAQLAAEQAVSRGAYGEATSLIESGLKLLEKLPEGDERMRAELALRSIEAAIAHVMYGAPSPERERAIRRMYQLGERIGEVDQFLRGLLALCQLYFVRGEPLQGLELAHRCIGFAETIQESSLLADAYTRCALLDYSSGKLRQAVSHFEDARIHSARTQRTVSPLGFLYTTSITNTQPLTLQLLGRISEASKLAAEGLREVREARHLFSLGLMLRSLAAFRGYRREPESALRHAEELVALSEENGFKDWLSWGRVYRGCALGEMGQPQLAISEMEAGLAGFRRAGGAPGQQYAIALLTTNYARIGQIQKALTMLNEALAHVERTGETTDQADMLRLKGEMLRMHESSVIGDAEKCFREALEVARVQEAKWWELRVSVSLARLLRDTNRHDEARTLLSEIYGWFTEGFDLADLKEAKTLLDELVG